VFTARYELISYIQQIAFRLERLMLEFRAQKYIVNDRYETNIFFNLDGFIYLWDFFAITINIAKSL
jgi:hypothetical protein